MGYYDHLVSSFDKKINQEFTGDNEDGLFDFRTLVNSFENGGAVALMRLNTLIDNGWDARPVYDSRYTANSYIELTHPLTSNCLRLTGDGVIRFVNAPGTDPILPDQSRYFQSFVDTIGEATMKRNIGKYVPTNIKKISRIFSQNFA